MSGLGRTAGGRSAVEQRREARSIALHRPRRRGVVHKRDNVALAVAQGPAPDICTVQLGSAGQREIAAGQTHANLVARAGTAAPGLDRVLVDRDDL